MTLKEKNWSVDHKWPHDLFWTKVVKLLCLLYMAQYVPNP